MAKKIVEKTVKRFKIAVMSKLRECRRRGGSVYVTISIAGHVVSKVVLDPKTSDMKPKFRKLMKILRNSQHHGFENVNVEIIRVRDYMDYIEFMDQRPSSFENIDPVVLTVLYALNDTTMQGRPGGKSFRLICQEIDRIFFNDELGIKNVTNPKNLPPFMKRIVTTGLKHLIQAGVVVISISGAFFIKDVFRAIMRENNIGFLPTR